MEKRTIIYLMRSQLEPHPQNPRKDLGDLEELRESIRVNGIMQNLTVIPTDETLEHFYILIGHRRFAASEGILNELPCVMVEGLSDREQIGIMLCENLQRSDLTYYEQGQGFQMMLDLGDTIDQIEEKTGFSRSTIKHRVEIAKLSKDAIENDRSWQLSISDLITLEKVKDIKKRDEILRDSFSSDNLYARINNYVREKNEKENAKASEKILKGLGIEKSDKKTPQHWNSDNEIVVEIDLRGDHKPLLADFEKLADRMKVEYFYEIVYGFLYVMKKIKKTPEKKKKTAAEIKAEDLRILSTQIDNEVVEIARSYVNFIIYTLPRIPSSKIPDREMIAKAWDLLKLTGGRPGSYYDLEDPDLTYEEFIGEDNKEFTSPYIEMLLISALELRDSGFLSYTHEPLEDIVKAHRLMFNALEKHGFYIDGDRVDKGLVFGTSDRLSKLENLRS